MCGILGFLTASSSAIELEGSLRRMAAAIAHRGPDADGFWWDEQTGIALGHRRLSIVDLSPTGHQPMNSSSGRYQIVFNGEIYNFQDLRNELSSRGATFRGTSDTEVLLEAFEEWGVEATITRLIGMFAIALWDRQERTLKLIRDRLGEKPLYYGRVGDTLLFGSELKALQAHPAWRGEIDRNALSLYCRHNYIPAPFSIYSGIYKLTPGTILTLRSDLQLNLPSPVAYWSLHEVASTGLASPFLGTPNEAVNELEALLRDAIGRQMMADVPLGAFLSGGIDSSTVVALMQVQSMRPVKTFSVGFQEEGFNEAKHARAVAKHLGTEHTELYITPEEALAVIPRLPQLYDEPFADSSQIPTFLVAQLARQHVTVSLSGDAGDELFGGYNRYFWADSLWQRVGRVPLALRRGTASAITGVSPQNWDTLFRTFGHVLPEKLRFNAPGDKLHKLARVLGASTPEAIYRQLVSHWNSPETLVKNSTEPETILTSRNRWPSIPEFTDRMMYLDTLSYLPDDILVKVDRASMGVSLESRVPFLDHRIVEFAWRLPLGLKIRDGQGKWPLRQVLYRHVPVDLVDRPKMGFGVPLDQWLRGPLREWAEDLLSESRLRDGGYFHPTPIRIKWEEHLSGKRNWQYDLWDVLMFQAWLQEQQPSKIYM